VALVAAVPACVSSTSSADNAKVTIFAASSLTEAFTDLTPAFEADHPGVDVVLSFGSSSTLAEQVSAGAPADLVATADAPSMQAVADAHLLATRPAPFASNTMAIATPPGNPASVGSVRDLAEVDFVMCDPSAPCGAAAQQILSRLPVAAEPRSLEADVKSVVAKVTLGEADAGLVYVTDTIAAGNAVDAVTIPPSSNVVSAYYIGAIKGSPSPESAADWISLVNSPTGQDVLRAAGFGQP
jgi:molybdate transport system substrate-binding protein